MDFTKDIDIRQMPLFSDKFDNSEDAEESNLQIVLEEDVNSKKPADVDNRDFLPNLPQKQRELFMRIQVSTPTKQEINTTYFQLNILKFFLNNDISKFSLLL